MEDAVSRTVKWDRQFQPDPSVKAVYDELYGNWKKLYPAQLVWACWQFSNKP